MPAPDQSIAKKIRLPQILQVLLGLLVFLLLQIGLFEGFGLFGLPGQAQDQRESQTKAAGLEAVLQQRAWQRLTEANDVTFPKEIRYPFIYSRKALNLTWKPGFVFAIIMFMSLVLRFIAPKSLKESTEKCREGIFLCLTAAFIFTAIVMTLTKAAFYSEALSPLGLLLTGFTQLAYLIGVAVGANAVALGLIDKMGRSGRKAELMSLTITIALLSLLALIPDLGPLPRIGNRLLGILAMLGLGGLLRAKYGKVSKGHFRRDQDSSGPV